MNKRDDEIVLAALPRAKFRVALILRYGEGKAMSTDQAFQRVEAALHRLKRAGKVRYVRPNWERT